MKVSLKSKAEIRAEQATKFSAFSGLNLLHVKQNLAEMLNQIGRGGIFEEYSVHDISHVDECLSILDWLIPEDTKSVMSPADWLMTVLSIYFHDLGMLVTKSEFESRDKSSFSSYVETKLYDPVSGSDYRANIEKLAEAERNHFLYQEFVRDNHPSRIRNWIMGRPTEHLGVSHEVMSIIANLIKDLGDDFKLDLGLVCESHHNDDLGELDKYNPSQAYGNSDEETANVQYTSILLRASDLLHITRDRTPSVAFKLINPSNPTSFIEWLKQMGVSRIRPQYGLDEEGLPDPNAPKDTIEVYAYFKEADAFFGLTSYLSYIEGQIRKCNEWTQKASRMKGVKHEFPWRRIDETNIRTEGFIPRHFEFTIDQPRILDLLTGHTLYNDSSVVLRELVQNALDAVRFQSSINEKNGAEAITGKVRIQWNNIERVLSVQDNGTGMTQAIIEDHLLKVGASLYQDPEFRRKHPDFSSISRFGIGILSTFMVADIVEVFTCHPDDDQARHLLLRSVTGKYLISLLDKETHTIAESLAPHGTLIKLYLRPSAQLPDVLATARRWIVIPNCEVTVEIDNGSPTKIGYDSPKEALEDVITTHTAFDNTEISQRNIIVKQYEKGGVSLAYVVRWSEIFHEWSLFGKYALRGFSDRVDNGEKECLLGTCIEGVRVEPHTPGFQGMPIVAIANVSGPSAPKTNVVRSGLESGPELDRMLENIYSLYMNHISNEIKELHNNRNFSLTWAVQESIYLLDPLIGYLERSLDYIIREESAINPLILYEQIKKLPLLLIEHNGERKSVSPGDFSPQDSFWIIDCPFFKAAESIIREVPSKASLSKLIKSLGMKGLELPDDPVLCFSRPMYELLQNVIFIGREVDMIKVYPEHRRVDLRWNTASHPLRWQPIPEHVIRYSKLAKLRERYARYAGLYVSIANSPIVIGREEIEISGLSTQIGIQAFDTTYILHGSKLAHYMLNIIDQIKGEEDWLAIGRAAAIMSVLVQFCGMGFLDIRTRIPIDSDLVRDYIHKERSDFFQRAREGLDLKTLDSLIDVEELCDVVNHTEWDFFNPSRYTRAIPY